MIMKTGCVAMLVNELEARDLRLALLGYGCRRIRKRLIYSWIIYCGDFGEHFGTMGNLLWEQTVRINFLISSHNW